jgi:hypothetical protein
VTCRPASSRSQAEALAVGLELGAVSVADVVAWADAMIVDTPCPHWTICELAMMSTKYEQDVIGALREIPGTYDSDWVRAEVVRALARGLAADRGRADQIACALYAIADWDALRGSPLESLAWWAWDELSLADDGLGDKTREQIIDEMIAAFADAAPPPPSLRGWPSRRAGDST